MQKLDLIDTEISKTFNFEQASSSGDGTDYNFTLIQDYTSIKEELQKGKSLLLADNTTPSGTIYFERFSDGAEAVGSIITYSALEGGKEVVSQVIDEVLRNEFLPPCGIVETSRGSLPQALDKAIEFITRDSSVKKGLIYFKQIPNAEKIVLGYATGSRSRDLGLYHLSSSINEI